MAGAGAPTLVLRGRSDRGRAAVGKASREGGREGARGGREGGGYQDNVAAKQQLQKYFKVVKGQCFPSSI